MFVSSQELPLGCLQPLQWSLGSHLIQHVAARGKLVLGHALIMTAHAPIDSPGRLDSELCYLTDSLVAHCEIHIDL